MDCNIPSGEALCRQFFYGIKYFKEEFGIKSDTFWLPDTFGYSAQLPQIVELCGMKNFFTQKLSWNNINEFPHTSFYWVGLNGSKILTHMAPAETYSGQCTIPEFIKSEKNNREKCYTNESLYVFGNGDGGGGPLPAMLERLERCKNLQGLPKIKIDTVDNFYNKLRKSKNLPFWYGELYFELHRGTYTTHAMIKKNNRTCEFMLREIEYLGLLCYLKSKQNGGFIYPNREIDFIWEKLLVNQFHDVLPGTIIKLAYIEVMEVYELAIKEGMSLIDKFNQYLFENSNNNDNQFTVINPCCWNRNGILKIKLNSLMENNINENFKNIIQKSDQKNEYYVYVSNVTSFSCIPISLEKSIRSCTDKVTVENKGQNYFISNKYIHAVFDSNGLLTKLYDKTEDRDLIPKECYGNVFRLYEDIPFYWDAWDVELYHLEKNKKIFASDIAIVETGPLLATIKITYKISETSSMIQLVKLEAMKASLDFECFVNWNENRKFLKTEFCFDILSDYATYETQYGVIKRPTHFNTSWDVARFEVCMHKFFDLSEYGYGVSILNDCKYGAHVLKNVMRMSLIRAPKAPDDQCDIGQHSFRYSVYPHKGSFNESDVIQKAYEFNVPLKIK